MAVRAVTRFRRGPRKHTDWSASAQITGFTTLAASSAFISQIFTPQSGGETIIRTRGLFVWGTDQPGADEDQIGAYGIGVVSAQAASVGITAVPHPVADAAWGGWLFYSYFMSRTEFGTAVGVEFNNMRQIVVDSKAMRKVGDEERLVMVVENTSLDGMIFGDYERILSKAF